MMNQIIETNETSNLNITVTPLAMAEQIALEHEEFTIKYVVGGRFVLHLTVFEVMTLLLKVSFARDVLMGATFLPSCHQLGEFEQIAIRHLAQNMASDPEGTAKGMTKLRETVAAIKQQMMMDKTAVIQAAI